MKNPIIADNKPIKVNLVKGQEYYFCTCGKSKNQPFCDGSHAGTSFTPQAIVAESDEEAYLCACKHSANKPYCDGTHQQFSDDEIGKEGLGSQQKADDLSIATATHEEPTIEYIHQLAKEGLSTYLILDGRGGGGTGAAPEMFRDHISVPTIPALARARHYLDEQGASGRVTLIITGGLRVPIDFVKVLALGADGVALSNSAMQAIGCVGARMCNTNHCPAGIATQKESLRRKLNIEKSATQLSHFFNASSELMQVMARACGHDHLAQFNQNDLATWHQKMAQLSGVAYSGFDD